jgi:autotransporter-associated beta strand protein
MAGWNSGPDGRIGSHFNLKARLSLGTALALGAWSLSAPAQAACSNTAPVDDETVTCSGTSTTGVIADTATGVTVDFDPSTSLIPPTGQAVNLGAGAHITVGAGSTIGNNANENTYSIRIGDGSSVTVDGLVQGRGGITGPGTDASTNFNGFSNSTIVVNQGGEVTTNGLALLAAINGRGGGNSYTIDGTVRDLNQGGGIMVGDGDVLNLGATGQLISLTGNSANPVYGSGKTGVTITTEAGSLIELHGLGQGISLGANADVTVGGLIRSYGDTYPNVNSSGGVGVQVGANSTVRLLEGGQIITGNTMGLSNQGTGGIGISTFVSTGPSNSDIFVDGLIDTQRALGIFSGIGDDITVGATGRITTRSTSYAILGNIWTSTTDFTYDLDIAGTVEQLGTARAIFLTASRQTGEVVETAAQANITVQAGGVLYAAANLAYGQDDGFSTYPEIIDNFIVAGTVARGTAGTVIDLNDGADRITFLPTYSLTGNITGGSDQGGPSNPTETDTFALDGGVGTNAAFNFTANQISNFEAGEKLGQGTWTLTGTTTGLTGLFSVQAGKLVVDGTLSNTGALVASGATLGGSGAFGGAVTIADGGALLGAAGADLGFGSLVLNDASQVQVALGAPGNSALFAVTGALTLDGRLAITDAGGFGLGNYRLIDYGGALTNNGLVIQSTPAGFNPGDWSLDLGTANQVNLVVAQGAGAQYWDGPNMSPGGIANGRGGSGVWNGANTNWTNQPGNINAPWAGGIAIFNPAAGVSAVEVVGEQTVGGMQFLSPGGAQGYVFTPGAGGAIAISAAQTEFDVAGDSGGAVTEASIGVAIGGAGGLLKAGDGDLALTVANSYTGATRVEAGQVIAGVTGALSGGPVTVAGGTLAFSGAGTSAGALQIATLTGGELAFLTGTGAGTSTTTNGGTVSFAGTANAASARIVNQAGGVVDLAGRDGDDEFNLGSLTGLGTVRLGDQTMALGALDLDEVFGGVIENGPDAVSGANQLIKTGSGTLTLTGANTYAGFTTVREGTLLVDGGIAGDLGVYSGRLGGSGTIGGEVTVLGGATLLGEAGQDLQMGSLVLNDTSLLDIALGAPSDTALFLVDGALTLDGRLLVSDAGGFDFGTYRLFDYGGTLTDFGLVIQSLPAGFNPGDWEIDLATAGQVSLIVSPFSGTQYWDGSNLTPGHIANGRGGTGTWNAANTNWSNQSGTINAPWVGQNAVFAAAGASTVTVEGSQAFTGLQFLDGANYSFVAGPAGAFSIAGSTPVVLDQTGQNATSVSIAAPISGEGGIVKDGGGTLTLAGANSYAGGTTVLGGVLEVASDGALGDAEGSVMLDGGTLRIAGALSSARDFVIGPDGGTLATGANAVTLSGTLAGSGDLLRSGSSTLTWSGNGSAYTGTFTLGAGTLALTGTLGGTLELGDGARLAGSGTLDDLLVNAGGAVAPGASIGTLTATGDAVFHDGSFFDLEIAASGASDRLEVDGTATIEGGTVRIVALDPDAAYADGTRYTFLTADGGVTGTFDGLTETSAFLDFALGYGATSAFVDLELVRAFPAVALTFNQTESAKSLAGFGLAPNSDSRAVYNALLMTDASAARAAFDSASGEIYAVTLAGAMRQAETEAGRMLRRAVARTGEGWSLWGEIAGQRGHVDADGNGARWSGERIAGTIGLDYRAAEGGWGAGLGAGYWSGDADLPARTSHADSEGWQLGGYVTYGNGGEGPGVTVAGLYASGDADVGRTITAGSLTRDAASSPDLESWSLAGELRYGLPLGSGWAAGPIARASHAGGSLGAFSESGAGSLDLEGGDSNSDRRSRIGGGGFLHWAGDAGAIDLTVLYARAGDDPTEVTLALAGASASHRVRSAQGGGDFVELGATGSLLLGSGFTLRAGADAALAGRETAVAGRLAVSLSF